MMGVSWGGFNALQVASLKPLALKAIVTVCSSDDRYRDDVHYMGGTLLKAGIDWGSFLFRAASHPPDPALVGDGWMSMWRQRLENVPLLWKAGCVISGAYWLHGSVCEDYSAIQCPVFAVGGWTDGYTNTIPRLLERLQVPRKGLIGPWAHGYPHIARPGPQIGFLQEILRWWDHWLKGEANGVMDEPMLRAWRAPAVDHVEFTWRVDRRGPLGQPIVSTASSYCRTKAYRPRQCPSRLSIYAPHRLWGRIRASGVRLATEATRLMIRPKTIGARLRSTRHRSRPSARSPMRSGCRSASYPRMTAGLSMRSSRARSRVPR